VTMPALAPWGRVRSRMAQAQGSSAGHASLWRPADHPSRLRLVPVVPDTFAFDGSRIQVARQISNAVSPLLAPAVAAEVGSALAGRSAAA
jgi:DNA (cytosine-5)-methyltransferase 1